MKITPKIFADDYTEKTNPKKSPLDSRSECERIIGEIGAAKEILTKFAEECENSAYEAAKLGNIKFRDECLQEAVQADCVIADLNFFVIVLKRNLATVTAFKALSQLPKVMKSDDIFKHSKLNVKKITKVMTKMMRSVDHTKGQLGLLHTQMKPNYCWADVFNQRSGEISEEAKKDMRDRYDPKL